MRLFKLGPGWTLLIGAVEALVNGDIAGSRPVL